MMRRLRRHHCDGVSLMLLGIVPLLMNRRRLLHVLLRRLLVGSVMIRHLRHVRRWRRVLYPRTLLLRNR